VFYVPEYSVNKRFVILSKLEQIRIIEVWLREQQFAVIESTQDCRAT